MWRQQGNEWIEIKEYYYGSKPYRTLDQFVQEIKAQGLGEVELVDVSRSPIWGDGNTHSYTLAIIAGNICYNFYNKYQWTVESSESGRFNDASVYGYLLNYLTLAGMHVTEELQRQGLIVKNKIWSNKTKPDKEKTKDLVRMVADEMLK